MPHLYKPLVEISEFILKMVMIQGQNLRASIILFIRRSLKMEERAGQLRQVCGCKSHLRLRSYQKLVVDTKYGEIIGAHIVGNRACDMISELVNTMALEGGYQELARIIHPHPTISEAVPEAARAIDGWATHA